VYTKEVMIKNAVTSRTNPRERTSKINFCN